MDGIYSIIPVNVKLDLRNSTGDDGVNIEISGFAAGKIRLIAWL
jgi:hypothetical protein